MMNFILAFGFSSMLLLPLCVAEMVKEKREMAKRKAEARNAAKKRFWELSKED